eukprot:5495418-Prymnesium_polylepis.1
MNAGLESHSRPLEASLESCSGRHAFSSLVSFLLEPSAYLCRTRTLTSEPELSSYSVEQVTRAFAASAAGMPVNVSQLPSAQISGVTWCTTASLLPDTRDAFSESLANSARRASTSRDPQFRSLTSRSSAYVSWVKRSASLVESRLVKTLLSATWTRPFPNAFRRGLHVCRSLPQSASVMVIANVF